MDKYIDEKVTPIVSYEHHVQSWYQYHDNNALPESQIPKGYYVRFGCGAPHFFMVCGYGRKDGLQPHIKLPKGAIPTDVVNKLWLDFCNENMLDYLLDYYNKVKNGPEDEKKDD
jgi:hypothetical protein